MTIYLRAREMAEARGIIIAGTKIELGLVKGEVIVIDELLTPDSSRFWPMENYHPAVVPQSFDKQIERIKSKLGQDFVNDLCMIQVEVFECQPIGFIS